MIIPHQRCGYSDSPFARIYFFLYCRVQKWVWALWIHTHKRKLYPRKYISYRKIYWGRQTGWKTRPRSAGSDNSASWSCKRRVTAKVVQNWQIQTQNLKNQGFINLLGSGNPNFSRRRPTQPSRPVGFKQETTFKTWINPKNWGFNHLQALFTKS